MLPAEHFPIQRCTPELLLLIFEVLVDDEASKFDPRDTLHAFKLRAAAHLALVCKAWKELVFSSPTLWPVLVLNLEKPFHKVYDVALRYSQLAKSAPVDVYVYTIHKHPTAHELHTISECASTVENITILFSLIDKIRALQIHFHAELASVSAITEVWSRRSSIIELRYMISGWPQPVQDIPLATQVEYLPFLTYLWINCAGSIRMPKHTSTPLLPNLRKLYIMTSSLPMQTSQLGLLLSHCPRLEEIDSTLGKCLFDDISQLSSILLPKLRKITTHAVKPFTDLFRAGVLKLSALESFSSIQTMNTAESDDLSGLLQQNDRLTSLYLSVNGVSAYGNLVHSIKNLQYLFLHGTGDGQFLRPLFTPLSATDTSQPTLPHLGPSLSMTIMVARATIHQEHFSDLVAARFVPVNARGETIAGCPAITELKLLFISRASVLKEIEGTDLWKAADVTFDPSDTSCRLRWTYRPNDVQETSV